MKKICIFLIITLISVANVNASQTIAITFPNNQEDDSQHVKLAKGLLLKGEELIVIDDVKVDATGNFIRVVFNVSANDQNFVGAFIEDEDGKREYSSMKQISSFISQEKELAQCSPKTVDITLLAGNESLLMELVQVRQKSANLLDEEIAKLLSEDLIFTINNLEKYFGLTYDTPISANMPKEDLLIRLKRIQVALTNVKTHEATRVRIERDGHIIK